MSDTPPQYAFVTLVTSDYYLPGALVVAAALRELHPSPPRIGREVDPRNFHIICLVTPETVNVQTLKLLRKTFDVIIGVEVIEEDNEEALKLLGRPDLKTVLTKLHVFRLKSYRKIIYLDADVLPLLPLSHLFHNTSPFAAVPDVGWPDIFNSGVFVFTPGEGDFEQIMKLVKSEGSWDGGDQGILNEWRGNNWERLSFLYNTTPTGIYTYAPAYKRFGSDIKAIHFIGSNKPWSQAPFRAPSSTQLEVQSSVDTSKENTSYVYSSLIDRWFAVFDKHYRSTAPIFTTTGSLMPTAIFLDKTYENVWDSGTNPTSDRIGLGELRRLALEGLGQTPTIEAGEGAYMTLPLGGRLDLMPLRRSYFRMKPSLSSTLSHASTDSSESLASNVTTPTDELPECIMISKLSVAQQTRHEEPGHSGTLSQASSRWDPWTRPYPNTWDLVPGIVQRYSNPSMFSGTTRGTTSETVTTENTKLVYRSWENKEESTSTDGDDEAEDGES